MTPNPESAALANHNGRLAEEIVQTLLPELRYVGADLDAEYRGRPLEIKSCQMICQASDRGQRPGRFWFRADQDMKLKEEDGYYALVVLDLDNACFFCLAEARRLLRDFSGAMTVSWRTLARRVA